MLSEDIVKFQLENIYKSIDLTRSNRQNIKKWCLTVWLAIVVAIMTERIPSSGSYSFFILNIAIVVFWLYEGINSVHTLLFEERARMLETLLISGEYSVANPEKYFAVYGNQYITLNDKSRKFLIGCFRMETIFVFYVVLIILSLLILFIK